MFCLFPVIRRHGRHRKPDLRHGRRIEGGYVRTHSLLPEHLEALRLVARNKEKYNLCDLPGTILKDFVLPRHHGIKYIDLAVSSVFFMTSSAVSPFSAAISSATYLR